MNTRQIASEYRLAHWAQVLQERVANSETIDEFCQSRGVSRNTYFYWQRKLRETAAKQIAKEVTGATQALAPSGWARVSAADEPQGSRESSLPIEIGSCRIMVNGNTNPELLAKVCRVLVSLC